MSVDSISITNLNTEDLAPYVERSEKQLLHWNEPDLGYFIAESPNVIERALTAGYEPVSFLVEENSFGNVEHSIIELAQKKVNRTLEPDAVSNAQIPVYVAPKEVLKSIIGFDLTRGMLCLMKRRELLDPMKLVENMHRIVVLEDVVNPTNLGAITRSAAALGMEAVLLTHDCVDPLYRRAIRVSMGTVFQIPWSIFAREDDWISKLQESGFKLVSMALRNNSILLDDPRLKQEEKLCIIMGSEGPGLKTDTIERSDYVIKIPMTHGVDSLNVAAASAVAFWELGVHE